MSALLLLIVCLALGAIVARFAKPAPAMAQSLNWWVLNVALPALVLHLIPQLRIEAHLWFLPVSMWLVFLGAWIFFAWLGRLLRWPRERVGALTLVCGLGNTAFVGFPLIEALHGHEGLQLALITDQAGTFIALAVGGALVAAVYSGAHVSAASVARKVAFFPPFVALLLGVLIGALGGWPDAVDAMLKRIGDTLAPLALFSVGLQLKLRVARGHARAIGAALGWKLAAAPVLVAALALLFSIVEPVRTVAVLEAAMGPMVSGAILAEQHRLEPELVSTVLGLGVLLSFATAPLVNTLLSAG